METAGTYQFFKKSVYNRWLVEKLKQTFIDCYIMAMGCQFTSDLWQPEQSFQGT